MYAIACSVPSPLHVRDFVRLAHRDYGRKIGTASANAVLSPDRRFCWAGQGTYALYRHGLLPGPRNLEGASRLVLLAVSEPMTVDALDYCLKQLGYRYNVASLKNAVRSSKWITWQPDGRWAHTVGEAAEAELRREIPVVPDSQHAAWTGLRDVLARDVRGFIAQRSQRLRSLGSPHRFGLNWDEDPGALTLPT
ncbi:hypothetical protein ACFS5L_27865 [Streptomyces phyllanthi]|uniref:Uncharacterized protein n=1 Tax=Streptomyces phyllanthi TaxID=1803180 RepID=A0A5N8VYH4_9ACTN|nr:hypothetical protein [Streptomyces phyllanthi]MPY39872.1 hypothetical protein [Streptomyces phyllanthi]